MSNEQVLKQFDNWLNDGSPVAALVMRQWLEPVEGKDAVVFPPTYNLERTDQARRVKNGESAPGWYENSKGEAYGYNIDSFEGGYSVCQIDSVGSQANRIEPLFKKEPYNKLVPQVIIKAGDKQINLLDAGHRAADAIVRFSNLSEDLDKAFLALKNEANAEPLAKIAPTSLVFGAWDSRATQVKLPRIVRSVVRAFNVKAMHRSAQYIPAVEYVDEGLLDAPEGKPQQDAMSQLGLSHAPAAWTHGGIQVQGDIRRDVTLNLVALRALGINSDESTLKLRRYILGLSLVGLTAPQETFLREGCQLVPDLERQAEWSLVKHDGQRDISFSVSHKDALEYAQAAAKGFEIGSDREASFSTKTAKEALGQSKEDRKRARRGKGKSENVEQG
jgi:CRISPR-associated protein Csb1